MSREKQVRQHIDALLGAAGWIVQDYKRLNLSAGRGIALREVPLKTGPCDFQLLDDRRSKGTRSVMAKSQMHIVPTADQSDRSAPRQLLRSAKARDAVGVRESDKTDSRPLERQRTNASGLNIDKVAWANLITDWDRHLNRTGCPCSGFTPAFAARLHGITTFRNETGHKPKSQKQLIKRDQQLRTRFENAVDLFRELVDAAKPLKP